MRRPHARWILALAIVASLPLDAQSAPKAAMGKLVPVSDIRPDWLSGAVESPNGRFYLFSSYASNDSGFLRYDRVKRSWGYLGRGIVGHPRWSPNGRFVAYIRQAEEARQWQVWLVPMDTASGLTSGPPRRVSTRPGIHPATGPAVWSPDSRRIAFIARDSARMSILAVPFNGGNEQVLYEARGFLNTVIWSPDARSIFVNHNEGNRAPRTLRVSLDDKRAVDLGKANAPILDISPDGKWLAQHHWSRAVLWLFSTDGKSSRKVDLLSGSKRLVPAGWSRTKPDEMVALNHIVPTGIQRVSVADGRIRTVVAFDSAGLHGMSLSPDERSLAYIRLRDGTTQLMVSDTSGANERVLVDGVRDNSQWSPTGQHIAYSANDADIRVVEVATKKARELMPAPLQLCGGPVPACVGRIANVTWRSDGRALRYFERLATKGGHALELHEVDLDGRQRVVGTTTASGSPVFIARNDTLFLVRQPNALQLVNTRTGVTRVIYPGPTRTPARVDANGQWILLVAESGGNEPPVEHPLLVSLTTGEAKKYPWTLGGEVAHGDFLPDGRNFLLTACVTCREPNYVEKWDLILTPMNGDPPRILTGSEASFKDFWPIATTADGRTVFFKAEQSYNTRLVTFALPRFQ